MTFLLNDQNSTRLYKIVYNRAFQRDLLALTGSDG